MAILYAFQATGNGHVSRAKVIIPILKKYAEVDVLASGTQSHLLNDVQVNYRFPGFSFIYGRKGNLNYPATLLQLRPRQFWQDLRGFPIHNYRLIINDFEPVTAWAASTCKKNIVGLSHQAALFSPKSPRPFHNDVLGKYILKHFAPTPVHYGFHFNSYDRNIFTPVINPAIRTIKSACSPQIQIYLPAVDDFALVKVFHQIPEVTWCIYSRTCHQEFSFRNIHLKPISGTNWIKDLQLSMGVIMGAGFEGPAEILHLGLKLLVMPIKGQYEQFCNSVALAQMGVPVLWSFNELTPTSLRRWLDDQLPLAIHYPDNTEDIISMLIQRHY